jgi:hypothetical protein
VDLVAVKGNAIRSDKDRADLFLPLSGPEPEGGCQKIHGVSSAIDESLPPSNPLEIHHYLISVFQPLTDWEAPRHPWKIPPRQLPGWSRLEAGGAGIHCCAYHIMSNQLIMGQASKQDGRAR